MAELKITGENCEFIVKQFNDADHIAFNQRASLHWTSLLLTPTEVNLLITHLVTEMKRIGAGVDVMKSKI